MADTETDMSSAIAISKGPSRDTVNTPSKATMPDVRPDRLSALVSRFRLSVRAHEGERANLFIHSDAQHSGPGRIVFFPAVEGCSGGKLSNKSNDDSLFQAQVDWGGNQNPLINALPARMESDLAEDAEMRSIAALLIAEWQGSRCGSQSVVNRLGEVLLVRLFRSLLAAGTTDVGLLGGLADDRLCHAIVAIHEEPGRQWSVDVLANMAGLSASRFADRFNRTVGTTPMAYLRQWRMVLAHQDLQKGERVQIVADRYGYTSGEALARAFRRQFGHSPTEIRRSDALHGSTRRPGN